MVDVKSKQNEVKNGIYERNGHANQSILITNGAKNGGMIFGNELKMKGLDGEAEYAQGQQKPGNLVFLDNGEGEDEEVQINLIWFTTGELETVILERQNSTEFLKHQVAECLARIKSCHPDLTIIVHLNEGIWKCRICSWTHQDGIIFIDHIQNHSGQWPKQMNHKNLNFETEGVEINSGEKQMEESPPELGESEIVSQKLLIHTSESNSNVQGNRANYKYSISEIESIESDSIQEDELGETEADVERVLQKQMTHDLYCPNCNSCITRRVILRKRKRRVQLSDEDFNSNKTESSAVSKSSICSAQASDDELAEDDTARETGSVLFRCLSCFSLFIPTGNGSKLFRIFGTKNGKESAGDEQVPLPSIKKKWFASNNQETTVEQDSTKEQSEGYTKVELKESKLSKEIQVSDESGISGKKRQEKAQVTCEESAQDPVSSSQKVGLKLMVSPNDAPLALEKSEDKINNQRIQREIPGKDIVISIGTPSASEIEQGITVSEERVGEQLTPQIGVAVSETTEGNKNSAIEVVKSIVYGGLAESITSLCVVSSAAGADITTLNILALGLANLIGGFSVICRNLCKLRSDRIDQHSDQVSHQVTDQKDRYEELLGRRENFLLHAVVVILSYLIFGSLPAVAYGFSFRVNDDMELKLVVVGATSFLCITVLAIGKVYVSRPPKTYVKTVVTYVVLGFTASGISYVAGVLIKRILEKLGLFQSSSVANLILSKMAPKDSAWARY